MIILLGFLFIIIGIIIWYLQDIHAKTYFISEIIGLSILSILFGIYLFLQNIDDVFKKIEMYDYNWITNITYLGFIEYITIISLIYIGTVFYVIASYYHLQIKNWTLLKSLIIAIPIVLCEYQFSLRGNYLAHNVLKLNSIQIVLITMVFYFINAWLLNYFILKNNVIWWREIIAFIFIFMAFLITTSYK
jgi:uncharacterized protein (DUF486 family)